MDSITITHSHPLRLYEPEKQRGFGFICRVCKKPIYGPTIYCVRQCDFQVHKTCAELPKEIQHPLHSQHHLLLHTSFPYKVGVNVVNCDGCGEKCDGSVYHCSSCDFNLDLICAFEERKILHPSHEHPLFLVNKKMVFVCDACLMEKLDCCYLCATCQYCCIHKRCAKLPSTINVPEHVHPLNMVYSYKYFLSFCPPYFNCDFCDKPVGAGIWSYFCQKCKFIAHLDCAISAAESSSGTPIQKIEAKADVDPNLLRLPLTTDLDFIKYFITRNYEDQPNLWSCRDPGHAHLYFHSELPPVKLTCDACTLPILPSSPSFYCCTPQAIEIPRMRSSCNYFLHELCSRLPDEIQHPFHPQHALYLHRRNSSFDLYICDGCNRLTNGFVYRCLSCNFSLDVKCASLPTTILHDAHKHPLVRSHTSSESFCRACSEYHSGFRFECKTCLAFSVSFKCVQWSRFTSHRWDEHPLVLICSAKIEHPQEIICEICENDEIHPQTWFYHCVECDNSFDALCMPRYDGYSNIKFGGVLHHEKHLHPLAFRRRSKIRHVVECKCCHKKIKGGSPIFECTQGCDLGICCPCIYYKRWK